LVSIIANGFDSRGDHNYLLDANKEHLAEGTYIVKVRIDDTEVSRELIKVK